MTKKKVKCVACALWQLSIKWILNLKRKFHTSDKTKVAGVNMVTMHTAINIDILYIFAKIFAFNTTKIGNPEMVVVNVESLWFKLIFWKFDCFCVCSNVYNLSRRKESVFFCAFMLDPQWPHLIHLITSREKKKCTPSFK